MLLLVPRSKGSRIALSVEMSNANPTLMNYTKLYYTT